MLITNNDLKFNKGSGVKTINYVAVPDLDSGNVVSATANSITDTSKSWTVDEWKDKLVRITCSLTSIFTYGLVLSNTSDTLVFDDNLPSVPLNTCTYRIIDTIVLSNIDPDTIVACDIRVNSTAVVLPRSIEANERKYVHAYNELANNGDHSTIIMCRGTERQLGQKYGELNHKYEGVKLYTHTWMMPHWDVLQTYNIGRYADGNWVADEAITTTAFAYLGDTGKLVYDPPKRFLPINVSGKQWLRYTSLIPRRFIIMLSVAIEKGGGGNSVVELALAKKSGVTGIITELTDRIAVARLSVAGQTTIAGNIKIDLAHNDEIILIARRDAGTILVQTGAGVDIIEI
jgi:hypothetical protein